jgi:uncharacterized membrane protein YidH (DUF202 family)
MMKQFKFKKIFFVLYLFALLATPLAFSLAEGEITGTATPAAGFGFDKVNNLATQAGYNPGNEPTLDERISSIISTFLSFLGVIFMLLMIYGGFNWMTAEGDEGKVEKAKDTIRAAVIGLVIVIAAYAISIFAISRIWGASGSASSNL